MELSPFAVVEQHHVLRRCFRLLSHRQLSDSALLDLELRSVQSDRALDVAATAGEEKKHHQAERAGRIVARGSGWKPRAGHFAPSARRSAAGSICSGVQRRRPSIPPEMVSTSPVTCRAKDGDDKNTSAFAMSDG